MALEYFDTESVTTPSGSNKFADDGDGTGRHPYAKLEWGAHGTQKQVDDSDGNRLPVKQAQASGATRSTVSDNAAAVTLLAANANRKGAYILNTSSAVLYIGLGAVAPTTSDYTEKILQDQSWRVPECYAGVINGIWATDPNDGGARVTEMA